jgi:hypothetical protein
MHRFSLIGGSLAAAVVLAVASTAADPPAAESKKWPIIMSADRYLENTDCSLVTEVKINGESLGNFSATREIDVTKHIKPGRNTIEFATTAKGPAAPHNHMEFKIGPVQTHNRTKTRTMRPVLMAFRSDKDWSADDEGEFTHPFGPNPKTPNKKTVVITYLFDFAGYEGDLREVKEGDYILKSESYLAANPSVVPTVTVNGKSLGSFHAGERRIPITDLLKPGDNEIRVVSEAVANQLADIDVTFDVFGPVTYDVARKEWIGKKVTSFKAMQGWKRNATTHELEVANKPGETRYERVVNVRMESAPK